MKTTILFFLVLLYSNLVFAQNTPLFDNIPDRSVIKIEQISSGEFVQYGNTSSQVVNKFDVPVSISNEYWEMSKVTATKYDYGDGFIVYFVDDKLEAFTLTSNIYQLKIDQHILKIGNYKNTLQAFPSTYSNLSEGETAITMDSGDHDFFLIYIDNNLISLIDHRTF